MVFILFALLVASAASLDLDREGCGSLLQGATFTASSGTPGFPSLCNAAWSPETLDNEQTLTADLGQEVNISRVLFAGDPKKSDTTSMIKFFYSEDGENWNCVLKRESAPCRSFYSSNPPPVKGSDVNVVDLPILVTARYFRFQPIEPSPEYREGATRLRVDLIGCRV